MDLDREVRKLKYLVEREAELPIGAIDSRKRTPEYCRARQVLSCLLLVDVGISYAKLGKYIDRHRTSFYFYEKEHERYMSDARIYPAYNKLYNKVRFVYWNDDDHLLDNKPVSVKLLQLADLNDKINRLEQERKALDSEIKVLL